MTWDEAITTIDWSKLLADGLCPFIVIELIATVSRVFDIADILGLTFNMN